MKRHLHLWRLGAILAAALAVAGCNTVKFWGFEGEPKSGQPVGQVHLLTPAAMGTVGAVAIGNQLTGFGSSLDEYKKSCSGPAAPLSPEVAPAVAVLLPVVGELLFGFAVDYGVRRADELKEASEASYAARITLSAGALKSLVDRQGCLVLVRYDPPVKDPKTGAESRALAMVGLLRVAPAIAGRTDAFTVQPVFVSAANAAALTQRSAAPTITIAFGVTAKGIGKQVNGLPILASFGEASSAAARVPLEKNQSACVLAACAVSEPIPIPSGTGDLISLSVGVTEKGSLGFGVDVAKAQLSAIKAALGPVAGEIIKKKVDPAQ